MEANLQSPLGVFTFLFLFLTLALLIICVLNACFFKDLSLLKWFLLFFLISQLCCWKLGILPFSLSDSLIWRKAEFSLLSPNKMSDSDFFRTVVIAVTTAFIPFYYCLKAWPQITKICIGRPLSSKDKLYLLMLLVASIVGSTPAILAVVFSEEISSAILDFLPWTNCLLMERASQAQPAEIAVPRAVMMSQRWSISCGNLLLRNKSAPAKPITAAMIRLIINILLRHCWRNLTISLVFTVFSGYWVWIFVWQLKFYPVHRRPISWGWDDGGTEIFLHPSSVRPLLSGNCASFPVSKGRKKLCVLYRTRPDACRHSFCPYRLLRFCGTGQLRGLIWTVFK